MSEITPFESEVAKLIVDTLNLDVDSADIKPTEALFGSGLGLDSIDALELAMAISKKYGFQLRSDDSNNAQIFSSLRALTTHIQHSRSA